MCGFETFQLPVDPTPAVTYCKHFSYLHKVAQETTSRIVNIVERNPKQCITFTDRVAKHETEIVIDSGSRISIVSFHISTLINRYS